MSCPSGSFHFCIFCHQQAQGWLRESCELYVGFAASALYSQLTGMITGYFIDWCHQFNIHFNYHYITRLRDKTSVSLARWPVGWTGWDGVGVMFLVRMLSIAVLQKSSAKDFRSFLKKHICLWGIFITAKLGDNSDRLLIPWNIKLFTSSSAVLQMSCWMSWDKNLQLHF